MKNTVILYYPAVDFKPYYPCFLGTLVNSVIGRIADKGWVQSRNSRRQLRKR